MRNNDETLNSKIQERLQSNSWDFSIATAVIEKKRKRKKQLFPAILTFSAATAVLIMIMTTTIPDKDKENHYHDFITKQVEGTYSIAEAEGFNSTSIDSLIDDTLALR